MRLDFNLLWVEDQKENVISQYERIERSIKKEGFKAKVIFASSVEEAVKLLDTDVYGDNVDLILMDFDLGKDNKTGADGLKDVRRIMPYKDIIFYSAKASELQNMVADRKVQGVDCSTRNDLPDTVERVFEKLVKKVIDIDHSRGIVMGATSDIDYSINMVLDALFSVDDSTFQTQALEKVSEKMAKKRKSFEESDAAISKLKDLKDIQKHHYVFTSDDRLLLMKSLLALRGDKTSSKQINAYRSEVMPMRNDLGHIRAIPGEGFKRQFLNRKGDEVTVEMMRELRVSLVDYHEHFEVLLQAHTSKRES